MRDYWVQVEHPELGDTLTYCGPSLKLSESPLKCYLRAPRTGEHNQEIYEGEFGISQGKLVLLKQAGVI